MENETMSTYNGWANYATWRVRLEMFDGLDPYEMGWLESGETDAHELSLSLMECAEAHICETSSEGLARDYAIAFLSQVDWREIAEHMVADYAETAE